MPPTRYYAGIDRDDPEISYALQRILNSYGDECSVTEKSKALLKFGRNESVGTSSSTLMTLAGSETNETYVSTNAITHFASAMIGTDFGILK